MDDIKWFIGFLLVIGAIWLVGRGKGTEHPPRTATSTVQARTTSPAVKGAPKQGSPPGETAPRLAPGNVISETILPAPRDPNISYLQGKVGISSVQRGSSVKREYVVLQASPRNTDDVAITGLKLKSGISLIGEEIPRAWILPFPTNVGEGEVVRLRPGQRAYIISGRSPNGQSFQLNKCTGYFEQGMNFVPPLPLKCPYPTSDPLPPPPNRLSDACYNYLKKLGRCRVPPSSVPLQLRADGSCQAHIFNKISYNQCVTYYKNDRDFFQGNWHIYLDRNTRLWRDKREKILLLDENERLIDSYSY